MLTKVKSVYYCEYCNKHGLGAGAMKKHEKYCTLNPDRICRMCAEHQERPDYRRLLSEITYEPYSIGSHDKGGARLSPKQIYDFVDGCPMCALTLLRLWKEEHPSFDYINCNLDYQKTVQDWFRQENESQVYDG